jgi:hypothetical protein
MQVVRYYSSISECLENAKDLHERYKLIKEIKMALFTSTLKQVEGGNLEEMQFNDGQTIIRTRYQNTSQIEGIIRALNKELANIERKLYGSVIVCQDVNVRR